MPEFGRTQYLLELGTNLAGVCVDHILFGSCGFHLCETLEPLDTGRR
jgi:hypothetical protein